MPTKKTAASDKSDVQPLIEMTPGISPEQITEFLKTALQTVRIAYLNVGMLLVRVRDNKLYAPLGHANLESYAKERLKLGRASLYNYLRVYDWVVKNHPEWLDPAPGTFIPDLYDACDLIWIDKELTQKGVSPEARAGLEKLKGKALAGELKKTDRAVFRSRTHHSKKDGLKTFLSKLRALRAEGVKLSGMPSEIIASLDADIEMIQHAINLPLHVLEGGETGQKAGVA
jgi:hypothetical protein